MTRPHLQHPPPKRITSLPCLTSLLSLFLAILISACSFGFFALSTFYFPPSVFSRYSIPSIRTVWLGPVLQFDRPRINKCRRFKRLSWSSLHLARVHASQTFRVTRTPDTRHTIWRQVRKSCPFEYNLHTAHSTSFSLLPIDLVIFLTWRRLGRLGRSRIFLLPCPSVLLSAATTVGSIQASSGIRAWVTQSTPTATVWSVSTARTSVESGTCYS